MSILISDSMIPKISVIIPIYNPGVLFERCLKSLKAQTLKEVEYIFVDDGGQDGSVETVRKMAESDNRVRVLGDGTNHGAGISRNNGIEAAKGEYLSFVDADDYIANDFLELLYEAAKIQNADIARGTFVDVFSDFESYEDANLHMNKLKNGLKNHQPLIGLFNHAHWCAIYRREMIVEKVIRYGTSTYGEDTTFLLRVCWDDPLIVIEEQAKYYYVHNSNSLTKAITAARLNQQYLALKEQLEFLIEKQQKERSLLYTKNRIIWSLSILSAAARKKEISEDAAYYLNAVRELVLHIPWLDDIKKISYETTVLTEYGINLCCIPFTVNAGQEIGGQYLNSLRKCIEFAKNHPERKDIYEPALADNIDEIKRYYEHLRSEKQERKAFDRRFRTVLRDYPDKRFILQLSTSMRLFYSFGVNLFGTRNRIRSRIAGIRG